MSRNRKQMGGIGFIASPRSGPVPVLPSRRPLRLTAVGLVLLVSLALHALWIGATGRLAGWW
jgi:hypothetical protein